MTNRVARTLSAEFLSLKVRWLLMGAGALMLLDQFSNPFVIAAFAALVASNIVASIVCKRTEKYLGSGEVVMRTLRLIDGALVTGAQWIPSLRDEKLWLLGVPILLSEAIVSRSRANVW